MAVNQSSRKRLGRTGPAKSTRAFQALGLALSLLATPAFAACGMTKIVELPVTMRGLKPFVPVTINGVDESLAVSSGSAVSTLTQQTAAALKLPKLRSVRPVGIGGVAYDSQLTAVKTLTLSNQVLHDVEFVITSQPGAGALGQNLLGMADAEYDLANGAVRLFDARTCAGANLAYWTTGADYSVLTIDWQKQRNPHTRADARVNGMPIRVTFSTGTSNSSLTLNAAKRLGLDVEGPGARYVGLVRGIGPNRVKAWIVPVASFKIGKEEVRNTQLRVIDEADPGLNADMMLGADFFLSHRVFVANSQHQLYFTYNGGPVFRLDEPATVGSDEDLGRERKAF